MHITVYCPCCRSRYQLKPEMRGQRMRCPNPICREIFEVREGEPPSKPPPPPDGRPANGSVGEVVPMLPAEPVEEAPKSAAEAVAPTVASSAHLRDQVPLLPAAPVEEPASPTSPAPPSWHQAPPVRKPGASKARVVPPTLTPPPRPAEPTPRQTPPSVRKPTPAPAAPQKTERATKPRPTRETVQAGSAAPRELPPGTWEPPPVRRGSADASPAPPPATPSSAGEAPAVTARRRKAYWKIGLMLLAVCSVLGVGIAIVAHQAGGTEEEQYQRALKNFDEHKFRDAGKGFRKLASAFPDSERKPEYQFLAGLSDTNDQLSDIRSNPGEALQQMQPLVEDGQRDRVVQPHQKRVWDTYRLLVQQLADAARSSLKPPAKPDRARQACEQARAALTELKKFVSKDTDPRKQEELAKLLEETERAIAQLDRLTELLVELARLKPTPEDIQRGEKKAKDASLEDDPTVQEFLAGLRSRMLEGVTYVPARADLPRQAPREESEPSLLIVPRIDKAGAQKQANGVVFALARGVLYALSDEQHGKVLWATRVGIDTTTLPVRLPAREAAPEIVLVLSSDSNTLTARDVFTGKPLWSHHLNAPCLGRPLVVEQRAYVPTVDGKVHEIEIIGGHLLGRYQLGLPLTVGGARQEGTNLLFFPADRQYVYVLDPNEQRKLKNPCVAILQSKHPSGSLRGEPIIASWDDPMGNAGGDLALRPRYLVLSQTDGLSFMKLRAFRLPLAGPMAAPLQPEMRVRGWSWFPPHFDAEKISLVTDAGVLGLFGINQPHNRDKPLFPLVPDEIVLGEVQDQPGRAQVVHASEREFWVLAQGKLHYLQLGIDRAKGLQISRPWPVPVPLGSPLHAGQINEARDTLFVVTQALGQTTCLATAVNANTGRIRWQRQLGLLCQGEPLLLGGKVLALDQGAGSFLFDPGEHPNRPDVEWQIGGKILAPPLKGTVRSPPMLVPAPDGKSVYEISSFDDGTRLVVRRYQPGADPTKQEFELPAPLAGTPGLGPNALVVPLADRSLLRLSLVDNKRMGGRHWRSPRADADARGHVVWLGGDDFLATDGSRGLIHLHWPAGQLWKAKTLPELSRRIVAPPLVLPPDKDRPGLRVCVADSEGTLTLINGSDWKVVRSWPLGGTITAGPFVRGQQIGCVVDRRQLVWIDPARDKPLWTYTTDGEAIVGQPQRIGDLIVVADMSGRFVGLNPADGERRGGYTLKASVAPAAAPVSFGPDRAFAPLTDGTVLMLSMKRLQGKN